MDNKIEILVFSRETIKEFVTDRPYLLISIRDPKSEVVETQDNPNQVARLDLEFSDFDVDRFPKILNTNIKVFTKEDAQSIITVLRVTEKYINLIVVHCEAGISRSAGVAAALAKCLGQSDEKFFNPRGPYCPNRYVYRTLLNTYLDGRPIGE